MKHDKRRHWLPTAARKSAAEWIWGSLLAIAIPDRRHSKDIISSQREAWSGQEISPTIAESAKKWELRSIEQSMTVDERCRVDPCCRPSDPYQFDAAEPRPFVRT
jgi:hypothetical protein